MKKTKITFISTVRVVETKKGYFSFVITIPKETATFNKIKAGDIGFFTFERK